MLILLALNVLCCVVGWGGVGWVRLGWVVLCFALLCIFFVFVWVYCFCLRPVSSLSSISGFSISDCTFDFL
jgi:hypothetical protein